MRHQLIPALLAACGGVVSAAALPARSLAPALPLSAFKTSTLHLITLEEALSGANSSVAPQVSNGLESAAAATCSNPRVRIEWDDMSDSDKQGWVTAVKCLLNKPASGQFPQAKNRYEDLVSLHQSLTPNVHNNAKFLIWHRYYLWTFEDILRTECSFTGPLPWFDETRYAGHFSTSSVFSSQWLGGIVLGGNCVTDGQFADLTLNIGPGPNDTPHCLARNGDGSLTINTGSAMVNACNARADYADMEVCTEDGPHAYGHNGVGAVMADVYASPGDPFFWLHHGFIDRNYRIWQNADPSRITYIDGTDHFGNELTMSTTVSVDGLRPDVLISDIINTLGTTLCYKYNY